jgi:NF-X1-type zinc finger protein NFXL1
LACIQAWVKEAEAKASLSELAPGIHNPKKNREKTWHCPNCRTEYLVSAAPKHYYCFCGKTKDPEPNPWITPHSVRNR